MSTKSGELQGSFPQLVIGGEFSLVKANGIPYTPPLINGMWPFLLSTNHNPLRVLLELVFSKIDAKFGTCLARDDSAEQEAMSPCIRAKAVRKDGQQGWEYLYDDLSSASLKKRGSSYQWAPAELTGGQVVVFDCLCRGEVISMKDPDFIKFASGEDGGMDSFVGSLIQTQMIAVRNEELVLTTEQCQVVFVGGNCYAGENNAGQLTSWIKGKLSQKDNNLRLPARSGGDN